MRKDDERNPRPVRGSNEKGSQRNEQATFAGYLALLCQILRVDNTCARIKVLKSIFLNTCGTRSINLIAEDAEQACGELTMTVLPGILPPSDNLNKLNEAFHRLESLERSYSSRCGNAAVAEFLAELAQQEGVTLGVIQRKALAAHKKAFEAVTLLRRDGIRLPRILQKLEDINTVAKKSEDSVTFEKASNRIKKVCRLAAPRFVNVYTLLAVVTNESWAYFPAELHEIFQDWAEELRNALKSGNLCYEEYAELSDADLMGLKQDIKSVNDALINFVFAVDTAVDKNQLKPKLRITELSHIDECQGDESIEANLPQKDEYSYTQEDGLWLDSDLSDLEGYGSYDFEPGERESFKPVRYIPGRGFVIFDE